MKTLLLGFVCLLPLKINAQKASLSGKVISEGEAVPFANILLVGKEKGTASDSSGNFIFEGLKSETYLIKVSAVGFKTHSQKAELAPGQHKKLIINILPDNVQMNQVVVTGTLKEVNRMETPVPVEVYHPAFFRKNPTPSLFDAMQNINGVRPQLNCNVCNTGDIHINGLEGPYTMVLIDGMPIVSGLASVYGLSGIPNSMVERIEVVKGPASSLYGSEAVGGLINVITKNPADAPLLAADIMASSWQEFNADVGYTTRLGSAASILTGLNYFNYSRPADHNHDGFTDITLQDRISIFQKWNFNRKNNRLLTLAGRYLYEDRWGGEMNWSTTNRGGDEIYGESIYTSRWELIGNYQLPVNEKVLLSFSYNEHLQDSWYGSMSYMAEQKTAFSQLTWDKATGRHDLLLGTSIRHTLYDDNTPATASPDSHSNKPDKSWLPGIFLQNEFKLSMQQKLLLGLRYDYHSEHGNIWTPRFAYKLNINEHNLLRLNAGTGFRVVNLFTEEHAALSGSREVVVTEALKPEQSLSLNLNYVKKIYLPNNGFLGLDATIWHTRFTNQILPDYITDPNKIIYDNLSGHAVTQGVSLNMDVEILKGLNLLAGGTFMDVFTQEEDKNGKQTRQRPLLTERWTGTWAVSYHLKKTNLSVDYTGNLYGPMRLPVLGPLDPREEMSPWWSIQNIQLKWRKKGGRLEIYGGVKNLLNFTPPASSIARSHDPFDRDVVFDEKGKAIPTPANPYALTFDPSYVYAPNQGIHGFLGFRYTVHD